MIEYRIRRLIAPMYYEGSGLVFSFFAAVQPLGWILSFAWFATHVAWFAYIFWCFGYLDRYCIQWGLEYRTSLVFRWSIVVQFEWRSVFDWSAILCSVFEWSEPFENQTFDHLKTELLKVRISNVVQISEFSFRATTVLSCWTSGFSVQLFCLFLKTTLFGGHWVEHSQLLTCNVNLQLNGLAIERVSTAKLEPWSTPFSPFWKIWMGTSSNVWIRRQIASTASIRGSLIR